MKWSTVALVLIIANHLAHSKKKVILLWKKNTNESDLLYLRLKYIVKNCITIKIHMLICYNFFKKIKIDAESPVQSNLIYIIIFYIDRKTYDRVIRFSHAIRPATQWFDQWTSTFTESMTGPVFKTLIKST
jgi:hypothetical protein